MSDAAAANCIVGAASDFFLDPAAREIWEETGGVPRLINTIAAASLELACERGQRMISRDLIRQIGSSGSYSSQTTA